jgi:hypothetical protein
LFKVVDFLILGDIDVVVRYGDIRVEVVLQLNELVAQIHEQQNF